MSSALHDYFCKLYRLLLLSLGQPLYVFLKTNRLSRILAACLWINSVQTSQVHSARNSTPILYTCVTVPILIALDQSACG